MKNLVKKTLPILITLALTTGCSLNLHNTKTKTLGERYKPPVYDKIFSAKSSSSKSENGLEVFAAKYKDKNMYEQRSILKAPINELTYGWEIILKNGDKFQRLTQNSVQEYHPKISRDGSFIVFEKWDKENKKSDIYKIELAESYMPGTFTLIGNRLTDQEYCENPAISPDGKTIAYNYQGSIWTMSSDGTNHKQLLKLNVKTRITEWNEKGLVFAYDNSMHPNAILDFEKKQVRDYSPGN